MTQSLRIAFMGTPDFAVSALAALCGTRHEIVCVYTQPPRPKGRGQQVQPTAVQAYAETRGLKVLSPTTLKMPAAQAEFAAHNIDVAVVAAYGLLLPQAVLDAPRYGCLNIHASLLPRWRGASPIQRSLWAGDSETGISIMQMDAGLDTGPVILKRAIPIDAQSTSSLLHDALSVLGAEMIIDVLGTLAAAGSLSAEKQDNALATHAPLLTKEDGKVDWMQSTAAIDRQIRALNPWPGVWTMQQKKRLKILQAVPSENAYVSSHQPGTVLDKQGDIQCGQGVLRLLRVHPEGANKPMDFAAAVNGGYIAPHDVLG